VILDIASAEVVLPLYITLTVCMVGPVPPFATVQGTDAGAVAVTALPEMLPVIVTLGVIELLPKVKYPVDVPTAVLVGRALLAGAVGATAAEPVTLWPKK
jgi:hypothetical protein